MNALVAHYHEIGLKGRNREFFEDTLVRNLRRALRGTGYRKVKRGYGRVWVDFLPENDVLEAATRAARVFGVAYVGAGVKVAPELDEIIAEGVPLMTSEPFESFAVRARRSHAATEVTSQHINETLGQLVKDATGARVDLKNPEATLWVELFGREGLVYRHRLRGPGGLPAGVSGRMLALMSGGIDSPVAAWRMARRGAEVELLHFHGQPYTDPSSTRQVVELTQVLARYQLSVVLHLVPLAEAQREVVVHAPADMRVVLYRRTMVRIATALAREREAKALIMGDSLGQVASQTIENITTVDAAAPGIEILRPLIGMDKQEIVDEATAIGTYDISTRKYQDCCVLFEPRSPATRTYPVQADKAERELDFETIVGKALSERETRVIEFPGP